MDIATLGIRVERQDVDAASASLDNLTASATRAETSAMRLETGTSGVSGAMGGLVREGVGAERGLQRVEFAMSRMLETGNLNIATIAGLSRGFSQLLTPAMFSIIGIGATAVLTYQHIAKAEEEAQKAQDDLANAQIKWLTDHYKIATSTEQLVTQRRALAGMTRDLAKAEDELADAQARLAAATAPQQTGGIAGFLGRALDWLSGGHMGTLGAAQGGVPDTAGQAKSDVDRVTEQLQRLQTAYDNLRRTIGEGTRSLAAEAAATARSKADADQVATLDARVALEHDADLKALHAFKDAQTQRQDIIRAGIDDQISRNQQAMDEFERGWDRAVNTVQQALSRAFEASILHGKNLFAELFDMIELEIAKLVAKKAAGGLLDLIGRLLPGVIGAVAHEGGTVGSDSFPSRMLPAYAFAGAPRLHSGLGPDEFPAVLQAGEQVVPRGGGSGVIHAEHHITIALDGQVLARTVTTSLQRYQNRGGRPMGVSTAKTQNLPGAVSRV